MAISDLLFGVCLRRRLSTAVFNVDAGFVGVNVDADVAVVVIATAAAVLDLTEAVVILKECRLLNLPSFNVGNALAYFPLPLLENIRLDCKSCHINTSLTI